MNLIDQLQKMGYRFTLIGDTIRYTHLGAPSDHAQAARLLAELKQRRNEAITYLKQKRWVYSDVAWLICEGSPDTWPWSLFNPATGQWVTFNTPAELLAATEGKNAQL